MEPFPSLPSGNLNFITGEFLAANAFTHRRQETQFATAPCHLFLTKPLLFHNRIKMRNQPDFSPVTMQHLLAKIETQMAVGRSMTHLPHDLIKTHSIRERHGLAQQDISHQITGASVIHFFQLCCNDPAFTYSLFGIVPCQFLQQILAVGKMGRSTSQYSITTRKPISQQGKNAMTNEITGKVGIRVALILNPRKAFLVSAGFYFLARHLKQRPQYSKTVAAWNCTLSWHGSGSAQAGTTQQVEHKSLRLIVALMCQCKPLGVYISEYTVTRPTRSRLKTIFAGRHNYTAHVKTNVPCRT